MSGAEFHTLQVAEVARLTDDAVAIEFRVPAGIADDFRFIAGQHVIVRRDIDSHDVRRSYSLCVPAGSGRVRIAVKEVPGGMFSTFANRELRPGDRLEVTPPIGDFTAVPDPSSRRRYCAIAAGSGITPVISIVATLLEHEPHCEVTLIYGNRNGGSIMFLDELAELKDRYMAQLTLLHVLSRESSQIPLFEGRLDAAKVGELLESVVDVDSIDRWLLCGPLGVVESAQEVLGGRGVAPDRVGFELFFDERPPQTPRVVPGDAIGTMVKFTLGGRTSDVRVDPEGPPILDYVLSVRTDAPFSCRSGACASCRAVVTSGEVTMNHNWALTDSEVAAGQVLTCQSHPITERLELTYDI